MYNSMIVYSCSGLLVTISYAQPDLLQTPSFKLHRNKLEGSLKLIGYPWIYHCQYIYVGCRLEDM